jgi:hypothetical protein
MTGVIPVKSISHDREVDKQIDELYRQAYRYKNRADKCWFSWTRKKYLAKQRESLAEAVKLLQEISSDER